jgi:uncharacterized SAM-binding protein YcdF (DUF218 family)
MRKASRGFRPSTWASRAFFLAALIGCVGLTADFGRFAETVATTRPDGPPPRADGVVALTGGSDARLTVAVGMLESGRARRLLISGVNPAATGEEVRRVSGGSKALHACCIDLGRTATDTIGNAREVADWVERRRIRSLILVTDGYHMPRSLLEVTPLVPDVRVTPWPVADARDAQTEWWRDERMTRRLALEYGKYLVVRARILLGLPAVGEGPAGGMSAESGKRA